jgi:hypothetical protein
MLVGSVVLAGLWAVGGICVGSWELDNCDQARSVQIVKLYSEGEVRMRMSASGC